MSAPASPPLLEIAANSLESALAAQAGGADRIELCENLGEGGCTPSYGTLALARERLRIPLYVLIRPRGGDFVYSPVEWEVMQRDVALCVQLGCDGVVIGALTAQGHVDWDGCSRLVEAAGSLGVTFHRAYDCVVDPATALEQIVGLGCERILTSGAHDDALQGAAAIAASVARAQDRISIMAGAGITPQTLPDIARLSGVREFHASAKTLLPGVSPATAPQGLPPAYWRSSAEQVRRLRASLPD
jgi:copper homeostasis protein